MNPEKIFCPNISCPARGQIGEGNIGIHSQKDERYICNECEQTFTTTRGTIYYRLRTDPKIGLQVITLLAYGCPTQAIVQEYGLDERTVQESWKRSNRWVASMSSREKGIQCLWCK